MCAVARSRQQEGETPYKTVKSVAASNRKGRKEETPPKSRTPTPASGHDSDDDDAGTAADVDDGMAALYGLWQTEPYRAPPAVNVRLANITACFATCGNSTVLCNP